MGVVVDALSLSKWLNAIKLKYVSALRIVPSVVTLLCKLKCNKELELDSAICISMLLGVGLRWLLDNPHSFSRNL